MRAETRFAFALREFVKLHQEVEAVLQHVGLRTWDVLLVAVDGECVRHVATSPEAAEALCAALGVRLNRGWDDRLSRRLQHRDRWRR